MDERVDPPAPQTYPGPQTYPADPLSRETPVKTRSRLRGRIILLVLLGLGLWLGWHFLPRHATPTGGGHPPARSRQPPPQPVGAATIDQGDIRIILNELGTVTSLDTVTVLTQISGQLTQIGFQE